MLREREKLQEELEEIQNGLEGTIVSEESATGALTEFLDCYHHNTDYGSLPSVLQHGIISLAEQQRRGIIHYSPEKMRILSDTSSHINGTDGVSFSKVGLTDLYHDEDEYNPIRQAMPDILVDIPKELAQTSTVDRPTDHYGNEFVSMVPISPSNFRNIDIRMLQWLKIQLSTEIDPEEARKTIEAYNALIEAARMIDDANLPIRIREMSAAEFAVLEPSATGIVRTHTLEGTIRHLDPQKLKTLRRL